MTAKVLSAVAATLVAGSVFSQGDGLEGQKPAEEAVSADQSAKGQKTFAALPFCQQAEGVAEVRTPVSGEWKSATEGKFYPLGSSFRTSGADSRMTVQFGPEAKASIVGDSSFGTRIQPLGVASRTLILGSGTLRVELARNFPEGAFFVSAPGFTVKNPAGESLITYKTMPDGDDVVVRCVTGTLGIEGRHFNVPQMRAADEIRIRSTVDNLMTFLYGNSGDYIVKLDRGVVSRSDVDEEGKFKQVSESSVLDWHLSPKTKVRIDRRVPEIGERMSVAMMTFDAVGELKNNFAFTEGRAEVNSGELAPAAKAEEAAAVEKATKSAEKVASAEDEGDAGSDDSNKDNNNTEE